MNSREARALSLTPIGGPTVLIDIGGVRFLVDPTFDEPGSYPVGARALVKTVGPAITPADLPALDAVLLSHDQHPDNLDRLGRELVRNAPLTLTTPAAQARLGGTALGLPPWQAHVVGAGSGAVTVTVVPAQHGPDGTEELTGPVTGFVLTGPDLPTVYVSGDNASLACVRRIADAFPAIEVAVLFAGAASTQLVPHGHLTLTSADVLRAAAILGRARILPVHTEGWAHFTEGPERIERAFAEAGLTAWLLTVQPGETVRP